MCGILTYIDAPVVRLPSLLASGLHAQYDRGCDGAGYVLIPSAVTELPIVRRFLSPFHSMLQLEKDLAMFCKAAKRATLIFHHRWPTSTANLTHCAHPIEAMDGSLLVHNGIISNAHALRAKHEKRGIVYTTLDGVKFNDSEALAHDVALAMQHPYKNKKGIYYNLKSVGSYAFVRYDPKSSIIQFARNDGSPLNLKVLHDNTTVVSSQVDEILGPSKEWVNVGSGFITELNLKTNVVDHIRFHYRKEQVVHIKTSGYQQYYDTDGRFQYDDEGVAHFSCGSANEPIPTTQQMLEQLEIFDDDGDFPQLPDPEEIVMSDKPSSAASPYIPTKYRIANKHIESLSVPSVVAKADKGWLSVPKKKFNDRKQRQAAKS